MAHNVCDKMAFKVPAEIHELVPEELRSKYGIYWSSKGERYYVFRDVAHVYDPSKKRSSVKRVALGSIKDGVFTYSPSYLKTLKIAKLQEQNETLSKSVASGETRRPEPTTVVQPKVVREIQKALEPVVDPRLHREKVAYPLQTVLTVVLLAAFAGLTSAVSAAVYWRQHRAELAELIDDFLEEDISHDTINRVLRLIDAEQFHGLLTRMTSGLISQAVNRVFHIDGQAVTASKSDTALKGRYVFNAYDSINQVVVASLLIKEKKNEISTAIELLSMLDLKPGDLITADAMNTQKALVQYLAERGVGYCLAIKENHPTLQKEVHFLFATVEESRRRKCRTLDADRGRIEERSVTVLPASLLSNRFHQEWNGLKGGCIVKVTNNTEAKGKRGRNSSQTRYFMTTIPFSEDAAAVAGEIIRRHWSIENNVHWALDVSFDQDRMQCTNANYLSNRVTLNKIALNVLRAAQNATDVNGRRNSVKTMQQLCSTPAGAIETMGTALGLQGLLDGVKG